MRRVAPVALDPPTALWVFLRLEPRRPGALDSPALAAKPSGKSPMDGSRCLRLQAAGNAAESSELELAPRRSPSRRMGAPRFQLASAPSPVRPGGKACWDPFDCKRENDENHTLDACCTICPAVIEGNRVRPLSVSKWTPGRGGGNNCCWRWIGLWVDSLGHVQGPYQAVEEAETIATSPRPFLEMEIHAASGGALCMKYLMRCGFRRIHAIPISPER